MKLCDLEIHHVGYIVDDLEKTIRHLQDNYGIDFGEPYFFRPGRAWVNGKPVDNYCLKIAMSVFGNPESGNIQTSGTPGPGLSLHETSLELIQPVSGSGIHSDFFRPGKSMIQHICYSVTNYDKWRALFTEKSACIVFEAETEDDRIGYRRCFYAEDKITGMIIEIKEEPYFRK